MQSTAHLRVPQGLADAGRLEQELWRGLGLEHEVSEGSLTKQPSGKVAPAAALHRHRLCPLLPHSHRDLPFPSLAPFLGTTAPQTWQLPDKTWPGSARGSADHW